MELLECKNIKQKEWIKLKESINNQFTLVVIMIGKFRENEIYLNSKKKLLSSLGINIRELYYDNDNTKEEIINKILELNNDNNINGIMIQKPILNDFSYQELVDYIDFRKDIDGVSSDNINRLLENKTGIIPCTARAVIRIFDEYNISLVDRKIVIVGKSNLVGMPLYQLLKRNNQVILCDSKTKNIKDIIKNSEIVILSIGKANYFDDSYFNDGQVIIDVGTNFIVNKLVGDVDIKKLEKMDILITPVPGGVGQLTPIYLVWNLIGK